MLTRHGDKEALPNTQKQTQGGCQNDMTKKHGLIERTGQNSRKRAKRGGDEQSDAQLKTLFYKDAQETQ